METIEGLKGEIAKLQAKIAELTAQADIMLDYCTEDGTGYYRIKTTEEGYPVLQDGKRVFMSDDELSEECE